MSDVIGQVLNVLLLVIAIGLIGIVVVQRNEGGLGGLGGGTGGGGMGGLMTGRAAANLLTKITRWLAVAFFAITLALAYLAAHKGVPPTLTTLPTTQSPAVPVESTGTATPPADASTGSSGEASGTTGGAETDGAATAPAPTTSAPPTSNQ
jgi:preprotein translocase subunit SecG